MNQALNDGEGMEKRDQFTARFDLDEIRLCTFRAG